MEKKRYIFITILIFFVLIGSKTVLADRFIVDNTTTSANWNAAKWANYPDEPNAIPCTPDTAMQNAKAGDTVYFRGGVYLVYPSSDYTPALNPANSGTPTNRIVFMNYPDEIPEIRNGFTRSDTWYYGANFGVDGDKIRNYMTFDGFRISSAINDSGGKFVIVQTDHIIAKNIEIIGAYAPTMRVGNYDGFRLENTEDITIQNCQVSNFRDNISHGAGVKLYDTLRTVVEYCTFTNNDVGITDKDHGLDNIYRYNFFYDQYSGHSIRAGAMASYGHFEDIDIYGNVMVHTNGGIAIRTSESGNNDFAIYNNTIYSFNGTDGIHLWALEDTYIWNNILIGFTRKGGQIVWPGSGSQGKPDYCDHNLVYNNSTWEVNRNYSPINYSSLNSWRTSGALENGNNPGLNSIDANPQLVNSGTATVTDYKLTESSHPAAKTGGRGNPYKSYMGAWEWPINTNQQIGFSGDGIGNTSQLPTNPTDFQGN